MVFSQKYAPGFSATFPETFESPMAIQELNQEKCRLVLQELDLRVQRFKMLGMFVLTCLLAVPVIASLVTRPVDQLGLRYLTMSIFLLAGTLVLREARHSLASARMVGLRRDCLEREIAHIRAVSPQDNVRF